MTTKSHNGRDAEMIAIHLLTHPDEVGTYLHQKRWLELACLADYVTADVPRALAHTDPALYRALRKAVTEANVMGFGRLDAANLRALAAKASRLKEPRHRSVLAPQIRARIEEIKAEDQRVKEEILAMEEPNAFALNYLRAINARQQFEFLESLGLKADESSPTNPR